MARLGFEAELAGNLYEAADGHPLAIHQIAPPHCTDLGINTVLHAHSEQAGEGCLGRNQRSRQILGHSGDCVCGRITLAELAPGLLSSSCPAFSIMCYSNIRPIRASRMMCRPQRLI